MSCCVFNRLDVKCTNNIAIIYKMINSKLGALIATRHNATRILCVQASHRPTRVQRENGVTSNIMTLQQCRWYATDNKKSFLTHSGMKQQRHLIEGVIKERKERFEAKKSQLKESSQIIMQDIKKTKNEMKERMEEVIEKENIYTIPNFLTVSRIVMSPFLGYLVIQTDYKMALGLFTYAAITDAMDGMIARRFPSQQSKIGSFLDPMADKVLIATLFLSLTYVDLIPVPLTAMIISRDLLLVGAGFVIRYQSLPAPRTLSRYFDATHVTAQLQPTFISKVNTLVQLALVASTLAAPVFDYVDHPALHTMWYVTAISTAVSALSYIVTKNTYSIIKKRSS